MSEDAELRAVGVKDRYIRMLCIDLFTNIEIDLESVWKYILFTLTANLQYRTARCSTASPDRGNVPETAR